MTKPPSPELMAEARQSLKRLGHPVDDMTDEQVVELTRRYLKTIEGAGDQIRVALRPIVQAYTQAFTDLAKKLSAIIERHQR
jgi:hypothetical protein